MSSSSHSTSTNGHNRTHSIDNNQDISKGQQQQNRQDDSVGQPSNNNYSAEGNYKNQNKMKDEESKNTQRMAIIGNQNSRNSPNGNNYHDHTNDDDKDDHDDDDDDAMFKKLLPPEPDYQNNNDDDLDELLGIELNTIHNDRNGTAKSNKNSQRSNTQDATSSSSSSIKGTKKCCVRKYGKTIMLNIDCFQRTGRGLMGPHYVGVMITAALLFSASFYFTKKAFDNIGMKSGFTCIGFTVLSYLHLFHTVCADPGIVKIEDQLVCRRVRSRKNNSGSDDDDDDNEDVEESGELKDEYETVNIGEEQGWRFCGACSLYQPPNAAHCPDCNVCVDEYDHHCPWMGTCIGKKNMKSFMRFNFTWLLYLLYAFVWVTVFGPLSVK